MHLVEVVSLAGAATDRALRHRLDELGYPARALPPAELAAAPAGQGAPVTLFLLGASGHSREQVMRVLGHGRLRPSLALLVEGESAWDPDLLVHCCDCVRWPCADEELGFRLARLAAGCPAAGEGELTAELRQALEEFNLIGRSPAFLQAMRRLRRLVRWDAPVLVTGETGTGKELAARAIHYLGARSGGPFVPVNCGALPDHLVENELFGHERGAYTDARADALGAIGEAAGGTLFLDEIEALSPKAQTVLLRFLQSREYRPLGARRACRSDARVIAASNADLRRLCERREFRSDLFYRLDVLTLDLPPLRARSGDAALLARHFVEVYRRRYGLGALALDPRGLAALQAWSWPGNVRELENLIHRSVILCDGDRVLPVPDGSGADALATATDGAYPGGLQSFADAKARAIEHFERAYLTRLMDETGGNVTEAARRASKERRALGKLLKKRVISQT